MTREKKLKAKQIRREKRVAKERRRLIDKTIKRWVKQFQEAHDKASAAIVPANVESTSLELSDGQNNS